MYVASGRLIFKTFRALADELLQASNNKGYHITAIKVANLAYDKQWYAMREALKEFKNQLYHDTNCDYSIHEIVGKLEQKLKNKLDKVYIG